MKKTKISIAQLLAGALIASALLLALLTTGHNPRLVAADHGSGGSGDSQQAGANQEKQGKEAFAFTKVDLDLLEQANLLDQRLEKDGLVYSDAALNSYLERIGKSLLPAGEAPERVAWRFRVLRDPLANAFALPNGSIYVNTGLLALLENESQLASVLAHEVIHVTGRHSYHAQRSYRKKMVAIHIFQAAGAWVPIGSVVGATINIIAGVAPHILAATINGYHRELEQEADIYAANKLYETNYDPREMANTFKLLQHSYEVELIKVYYNDHPKLQERIAYVNHLIQSKPPRSMPLIPGVRERYLAQVEEVARHNVQLDLESGRFRTAMAISKKLVAFNPEASDNLYCLGEAYRALGPRTPELSGEELSSKGQKEARKLKEKMTLQEQETTLMSAPAGQSAWKVNQQKAEESYRQALELKPNNAKAHRGLGLLFEKAERHQAALAEYRRYLELQPDAPDRLRIQRRIEALEKLAPKPSQ